MSRMRWLCELVCPARLFVIGITAFLFQPVYVLAYDLKKAVVAEDGGIFQIEMKAIIGARAEYIRQVLTDYNRIYRLNPSIVENEVITSDETGDKWVRTKLLACNSVFCKYLKRVDIVSTLPSGDLQAEIVPELSDFRSGIAVWKITPRGDCSELVYEAHLEPDFFIPPFVGPYVVKKSLEDEFTATFGRVEKIASINAKKDWNVHRSIARRVPSELVLSCNQKTNPTQQ